ncbi:aminopeptidase N [Neptuniibacter caesariensis]|uniref:Aminopeptidase N n=1 Tax=Neptuniibacter caesariensis TaxID=207954 RepID=A0A7U8C2Z5_NEPCE|nr:aminopeptidase N [Neptuniibacter caesariensis]EAR59836.1 aminopeptidase N [Neptuniibacter caesariensis]
MSQEPKVIYLKDYTVPSFLIESTELRFELFEEETIVHAELKVKRNPACEKSAASLELFGHEELELIELTIDGAALDEKSVQREGELLILSSLPETFVLKSSTRIHPETNTALEGLYKSDGMFCTQCEAEGFRRITFFPDRPDVMSVFRTTVEADKKRYPVLLSNGNPVKTGENAEGRHWVTWEDPFPKPAYLFALVAGDLKCIEDSFTTMSGREVKLVIYAEEKDLDKLDYAMLSLQKSMKWDEEVYGREYDLDIYMIVAVDFFNMGAMENKGLNIFNTSCVLANPKTTTDASFQRVEGVVAHEYFHNWSGNRVTCRDWFQLSLKEGFTVFRDAEFSADMNSRTVKRVEDVSLLRTAQFAEDAGPMAHPIRPDSFIEISNFYTMTVYEKGAEVVRMIHTLLGPELFRKGSDLYFERHDGQAVTTEDFVQAMEDASGKDLGQFRAWYHQAGTPELHITDEFDGQKEEYRLTVRQTCPATPGQDKKTPFQIPLSVGLLDQEGNELRLTNGEYSEVLEVTEAEQTFVFKGINAKPVPSLLRGFSAPVKLHYAYQRDELMFLMANDTDGFSRWDAAQKLGVDIMQELIGGYSVDRPMALDSRLIAAYRAVLEADGLDKAMVSKVLTLPSQAYLSELSEVIDVDAIHNVREFIRKKLAFELEPLFLKRYQENNLEVDYSPDADSIARRSLKNLCLSYLVATQKTEYLQLAKEQYAQSDNMTDMQSALALVAHSDDKVAGAELLDDFYAQWKDESLVVNLWLSIQAADPSEGALARVESLMHHPAFDAKNPNKLRSLISVFCAQNPVNFHAKDGSGYQFLADRIIELNAQNPQIASRMLTPLTRWKKYAADRQVLMRAQLERIHQCDDLSKDVFEVVSKSLV